MKVVNLDTFLTLPEGTIFAAGEPWVFGELRVKGDTLVSSRDFNSRGLMWIDSTGDADQWAKLHDMLEHGKSEPISDSYGRDGRFDDDAIFLIYEASDLDELARVIAVARSLG